MHKSLMAFVLSTLSATSSCVSSPWLCWSATSFSIRRSTCSPPWRPPPPQRGCCPPTPPLPARDPCPPSDGATKRRQGKHSVWFPWMKTTCGLGQRVHVCLFFNQISGPLFLHLQHPPDTFSVWHKNRLPCASHSTWHTRLLTRFLLWISFCCFF